MKFGKCPTKPTELQGVILELLGIEKVACDKTPAEDEQTWVNKVIEDAKAYATKHGGTPPTLEMITLTVNIDVPEKLRAAVLAKVSDLPTILSMKPKVAAPF